MTIPPHPSITTNKMSNDDLSLDIFYGISSPWAYMGAERAYRIAEQHGVPVRLRPIRIIQGNGGIPLNQRPDARQRYHATELRRWSRRLGIALNVTPRFYPCRTIETAAQAVIAATRAGLDARAFSFAIQRALWAEQRDIADVATLREIAAATLGPDHAALVSDQQEAGVVAEWEANLADALALGIFGTPTYVVRGELFWGQDHLDFVDEALARATQR